MDRIIGCWLRALALADLGLILGRVAPKSVITILTCLIVTIDIFYVCSFVALMLGHRKSFATHGTQ